MAASADRSQAVTGKWDTLRGPIRADPVRAARYQVAIRAVRQRLAVIKGQTPGKSGFEIPPEYLTAPYKVPDGYIAGLGRDVPHPPLAHLYKGTFAEPGNPMCRHGWNRDEGTDYSIWRGNIGAKGICRVCLLRALAGLPSIESKPAE